MEIKRGIPVSPGVAISRAVVLDAADQPIPKRTVPPSLIDAEHKRLNDALAKSSADLEKLRDNAASKFGEEIGSIFTFHLGMLHDKQMIDQFKELIDREHVTAEYTVFRIMRQWANMFRQQESRYFRERVSDIWDLERRILSHLIGAIREDLSHLTHDAAIIAHELTPSQTASLDKNKIIALATDAGGQTSHTAILAHALGIPAIVGLEDLTSVVNTGDTVVIDGHNGLVIVNPDAAKLMEYRQQIEQRAKLVTSLDELANKPATTRDGTDITLHANIEFPNEIPGAIEKGATGVGLYRTEFIFLNSEGQPGEEEQYQDYVKAIEALDGKPLTIRTLDLGADKIAPAFEDMDQHVEHNPFLGCRSIRLCLQNLALFKTQLRAILRASAAGPIRIMFPLISNIMELRQGKMILNDVIEDLDEQGIAFDHNIPIGIMIEVPSAAIQAKTLGREVDFFSIGTNDLIQYTVAVDRGNERVASLYSAAHPAVIKLIKDVVRSAQQTDTEVSICGEMAGEPEFAMLLVGLGLRTLSMTPPALPEIKRLIRSVTIEQCKKIARKVSSFDTDREVLNYLRNQVTKVIPEILDGKSIGN